MEQFTAADHEYRSFRFGHLFEIDALPETGEHDPRQIEEIWDLLDEVKTVRTLDDFVASAFTPKKWKSRFTDGSFGVYYSALDIETAKIEAHDNFRKYAMDGATASRAAYYRCMSCRYEGATIDLTAQVDAMPFLVEKSGYDRCTALAKEARASGIDGFVAPSAARFRRTEQGTCLPIFSKAAVSSLNEEAGETFVYKLT